MPDPERLIVCVAIAFGAAPAAAQTTAWTPLITAGAEPIGSTPDEHAASMRSEIDKWKKVARDAGIDPQ